MKILTVENTTYDLDTVPDEIDDIRYCVLDASDINEVDFYFLPLVFLESFHAPAICLQIGEHSLQMPMDWSIVICDDDFSAVEVMPLASLNNRGFKAVTLNPMRSSSLSGLDINITNIFQDVKWYFPKLKNGHVLAVPLSDSPNPQCAYFVKEINKVCDFELGDLM
jgi:hypothetical protein